MLKNLSFIALLGIAAVGVPSELSAKSVKVAGTQKGAAAKSVTRQVAQQNVTVVSVVPLSRFLPKSVPTARRASL